MRYSIDIAKWDVERQMHYQKTISSFLHEDDARRAFDAVELSSTVACKELWRIDGKRSTLLLSQKYQDNSNDAYSFVRLI